MHGYKTKIILVADEGGEATGLIVLTADVDQSTKLQETTVENLNRVKHLSERITRLRKLFGECLEAEESLAEQTDELQANNEILPQQMSELHQSPRRPEQYSEQIVHRKAQETTANQRRKDTNPEHRQSKEAPAESSEPTHIRKFILASSCSLWYYIGQFHESWQLCVSPCKYTTIEFPVKTRLDGAQGWEV